MSYKRISPLTVPDGGTGKTSLTAYAVICGGTTTTGAIQSIASVGTSAQVLTSNGASTLPTFQTAPTSTQSFQSLSSDPGSPTTGQVWYNTTSNAWKGYNGSATKTFTVT